MTKVAVVTGSNKGIGFAIVRGLCKKFEGDVFLTARNEERGTAAVKELQKEGLSPKFHQLDITDHSSIVRLRDFLMEKYGGLDILINNAAIAYPVNSPAPFAEQAEVTVHTNFTCVLDSCDVLFPILRPGARVGHVSSFASMFALKKCSAEIQKAATSPSSIDDIVQLLAKFVQAAKEGNHEALGFPNSAYAMSKLGLTAITSLQQKTFDTDERPDIVVNACCPGYVDTDMSSHKGHLTIDQGAENPLYLALLPPGCVSPKGNFIQEKRIIAWVPQ